MNHARALNITLLTLLAISMVGSVSAMSPAVAPTPPGEETGNKSEAPSDATIQTAATTTSNELPNKIFEKMHGNEENNVINDFVTTADGNYLLAGADGESEGVFDATIWKISPQGDLIWKQTFDNDANQSFYQGERTSDGGFIFAGTTDSIGQSAGWGVKLNADGSKAWDTAFGYGNSGNFYDAAETAEGEYLFVGGFETLDGDDDAEILKTTAGGTQKWNFSYYYNDIDADQTFSGIAADGEENYHIAGGEYGNGNWDAFEAEINSVGEWQGGSLNGHPNLYDWYQDVAVDEDGDPYYVGVRNGVWDDQADEYSFTDAWVHHDESFDEWSRTVSSEDLSSFTNIDTKGETVVVSGFTTSPEWDSDKGYAAEYYTNGTQFWNLTADSYRSGFSGVAGSGSETVLSASVSAGSSDDHDGSISKYTTRTRMQASISPTPIPADNATNVTISATTKSGKPIAGATVTSEALDLSTTTNSSGVATAEINATSGSYTISVTDPEYITTETTLTVAESATGEQPIKLRNVEISPMTVNDNLNQHTLTFEAVNVSADGNEDEFSVTMPESVNLVAVGQVETDDSTDPTWSHDDNTLNFTVNPDRAVSTVDLTVTVDVTLSASS